jgi:tRNA nucleotidyltransferase (CCA-adding enzyme)
MGEKLTKYIYSLLKDIGEAGDRMGFPVFVVGGFVRDLLLERPNLDMDIVVEGDGIKFAHAFAEACKGTVKHHQRFGTAVVKLPDGFKIDLATARTEIYEHPGALPSVKPSSIKDDLRRRDFTINAMAMGLNESRFGELLDFFGGKRDIEDGLIRILNNSSFLDDPTRMFRAVRFETRYHFQIEPQTERLLKEAVAKDYIKFITGQRLRNEILLILKEDDPLPAIRRMGDFNLLEYIHSNISISRNLEALFHEVKAILKHGSDLYFNKYEVDHVLVNLLAFTDQLSESEVEEVSQRLALRGNYTEALRKSKTHISSILQAMSQPVIQYSVIYKMLKNHPLELLILAMAKGDKTTKKNISIYMSELRHLKPLVNGNNLREMGYPEGPLYSEILDKLFAKQLDGDIQDKDQAMGFIRLKFPL